SSKCISKYRLNDGIQDCYENDDETGESHFNKSNSTIRNDPIIKSIWYPLLCDGYIDIGTNKIHNETDETDCNWWPCNNIYTRCNRIWNCHNGIDEINCPYLPACPSLFHPCVSPETFNLTCLSIDKAGDGIVDCLGASDERQLCQEEEDYYPGAMFQCWNHSTCLDISILKVPIPSSILAHFITADGNVQHTRTSTFKRIRPDEDFVSIYTSNKFHLLFTEFCNNYYLTIAQEKSILSAIITTTIIPSQRCPHINELFSSTILEFSRLRRIKLYPLLCQKRSELKCFYDETFICLCTTDRFANCFSFNHSMIYNCRESHFCDNNAQCFQDKPKCPTKSMCVCDECFYGTYCQFSTKGFAISVDAILGYKIRPHTIFTQQSMTVKVSVSIVMIMFMLGLISSIFSIFTFQTEISRKVGCGLYLLSTSIISLLTMVIFLLKFFILTYTQINFNTHRYFHLFSCISIDFLLRVLLSIGDWLNACVAIERIFTVSKGANFDKNKRRSIAKWIIVVVIVLTTSSIIHDPIHRHLVDDTEDQRTW
ncbi:unnamed protein product, partial [Rotaria sp. Silwood1]